MPTTCAFLSAMQSPETTGAARRALTKVWGAQWKLNTRPTLHIVTPNLSWNAYGCDILAMLLIYVH